VIQTLEGFPTEDILQSRIGFDTCHRVCLTERGNAVFVPARHLAIPVVLESLQEGTAVAPPPKPATGNLVPTSSVALVFPAASFEAFEGSSPEDEALIFNAYTVFLTKFAASAPWNKLKPDYDKLLQSKSALPPAPALVDAAGAEVVEVGDAA
jgi:hypothetical protein